MQAFQVDTFAVSYQFSVYAQEHGWAYRKCRPTDNLGEPLYKTIIEPVIGEDGQPMVDEEGNPVTVSKEIVTAVYPMTKLYCDQNGERYEILN